jgi:hypothetical protein
MFATAVVVAQIHSIGHPADSWLHGWQIQDQENRKQDEVELRITTFTIEPVPSSQVPSIFLARVKLVFILGLN